MAKYQYKLITLGQIAELPNILLITTEVWDYGACLVLVGPVPCYILSESAREGFLEELAMWKKIVEHRW